MIKFIHFNLDRIKKNNILLLNMSRRHLNKPHSGNNTIEQKIDKDRLAKNCYIVVAITKFEGELNFLEI